MSANSPRNVEDRVLDKLVRNIQDAQNGLDPRILAFFYKKIETDSKVRCPTEELRNSISVIQNRELPMKFELKASKRAFRYVIEAVESNLNAMPVATRLYFQKFEEILEKEYLRYIQKTENNR
ncbi:MAG: hypothetical protein OK457_09230 [Thaumarchaeota archaeon]|nr:hypothetical protein [Nitrososphaerota archaeon]